jgi:hypothetical protein
VTYPADTPPDRAELLALCADGRWALVWRNGGAGTFIVGDAWITVPLGERRIVCPDDGVTPRLATEADVLAAES